MRLRRSSSLHEMQRAHVVQPVGELDQQHADVAAHRQHELAEILRLLGAVGLQFEPGQLGDAIDQAGDFLAETASRSPASLTGVSSITSCSRPVAIEAVSSR